jgi:DedD protein
MTIIRTMDRSLKARLIGASVLVLLVVLVVPELLSGRKAATDSTPVATTGDGPTRTYTIELARPGSASDADAAMPRPRFSRETPPLATEQAARATSSPEPVGSQAAPSQPPSAASQTASARTREASGAQGTVSAALEARAGSARAPGAEAPPVMEKAAAAGDSRPTRGTWSVQVGAFGSTESARKLVDQLEADGFSAYVSSVDRNGKKLHRVRVGPEPARAAADALAGRLKARGLPVSLVAND